MKIKAQIPNLFTMLNLFSGCVALVMLTNNRFDLAFYFVCLGIFFDFFDGFFARKFGVAGPLGVQLDSLADMVTSGVVPGYAIFRFLNEIDVTEFTVNHCIYQYKGADYIPYLGFVITLGACYRLAKFNIDTRQSDSFIGLPTPANALFFTSLPLLHIIPESVKDAINLNFTLLKIVVVAFVFLSAYVMNAEIPLFSLKIKDFSFAKYKLQIFFLALSVLILILLKILAVPLIIVIYVLLSVINNIVTKKASN